MKNYKHWLSLTCKWNISGLNSTEFIKWELLTDDLNKHCPDCEEGQVCLSCGNTGLKLNNNEKLVLSALDKCLK